MGGGGRLPPPPPNKKNGHVIYSEGVRSQIGISGEARNADLGSDSLRKKKKSPDFFLFVRKKKYAGRAARASWPVPGLVLEVQVGPTMLVRAQNIKNDPNWIQNRPFWLKVGPGARQDRSG